MNKRMSIKGLVNFYYRNVGGLYVRHSESFRRVCLSSLRESFSNFSIKSLKGEAFIFLSSDRYNIVATVFGGGKEKEDAVRCILSSDRTFSPLYVSCDSRENYKMAEDMLRLERGENARLIRGIEWLIFNSRKIKYNNS